MKLVAQFADRWCFQLTAIEADLLRGLLKRFPVGRAAKARISHVDDSPGADDRQGMLEESMAEHRRDLKRLARTLLADEQWPASPEGPQLTLTLEHREVLLQILNDIRLGCWRALGEPDDLATEPAEPVTGPRALMDLAGYYEMHLLAPDTQA